MVGSSDGELTQGDRDHQLAVIEALCANLGASDSTFKAAVMTWVFAVGGVGGCLDLIEDARDRSNS